MNNIEELIVASVKIVLRNEGYSEDRIKTTLNWNWAEIKDEIEKYQPSEQTKHGHWITGQNRYFNVEMYRCSECKNWSPYKAEKCPNCHVKMIGEKK